MQCYHYGKMRSKPAWRSQSVAFLTPTDGALREDYTGLILISGTISIPHTAVRVSRDTLVGGVIEKPYGLLRTLRLVYGLRLQAPGKTSERQAPTPRADLLSTVSECILNQTLDAALTRAVAPCYPSEYDDECLGTHAMSGWRGPRVACAGPRSPSAESCDGGQVRGESSAQRATRMLRASSPLAPR